MKHWSMQNKLTAIVLGGILVPVLVICGILMDNWKDQEVDERADEFWSQGMEMQIEIERVAELCNVTTQVFMQDSNLIAYLQDLQTQTPISNEDMYEFSTTDIAFMERTVAANPYIDHVRVYSTERNIQEFFPILFGQERMRDIGWDTYMPGESCWKLDYTDQLFSAQTQHLMGLISPIRGSENEMLGTIEVAVSMRESFPELFVENGSAFLVCEDGQPFGNLTLQSQLDYKEISEGGCVVWQTDWNGTPVLVAAVHFPLLRSTYYAIDDLSEVYRRAAYIQGFATIIVAIAAVVLWILVRLFMKRMLRQLYLVLDGVAQFIQGDTDTKIPIVAHDEIGEFTSQVNLMLGSIRDFVRRQIDQEVLIKNTQIKALQNQINAHFIYNVLESIKMMAVIDGQEEIATAIVCLGKLLRYTMGWKYPMVALKDELEYVKNYIALVNLRYDGQIIVNCHVDPELMMQTVPKVSLQPLVENAVVHDEEDFDVRNIFITATQQGRDVHISVTTDGTPPDKEALGRMQASIDGKQISGGKSGNGIGLHNIQERIHQNFGERYGLIALEGITLILPRRNWEGTGAGYGNSPDCGG